MTKRMIIMLLIVLVVFGGLFGYKIFEGMMIKKFMAGMGAPEQTVSTMKAGTSDWQPTLQAVGSLRAVNGADLSAEVAGIVGTLNFESGADVEKGTLLIELRDEDDVAKLHALEATAKLAGITLDRDEKQLASRAISQAVVDSDTATLASAKAQVAEQQAILDKKSIRAPFTGHLGIRQVDVGQYLNPGTMIVSLQQLDPLYVDFNVPEQALTQLSIGQKTAIKVTAFPDTVFEGEISALNSKIDEATRNVQVRASIKNPDHKLLPGMFASLSINVGKSDKFVTLPQTAVTYNPYGNTVYVVDATDPKKLIAKQAFVTTGETRGDQVAVLSGIKEGDEVVTSGQIKLRNGAPIKINNEIQPKNDANPKPSEQ